MIIMMMMVNSIRRSIFLLVMILILIINLTMVHCLYDWMHQVVLDSDNKFHLKWLFDTKEETITFNACVETKGWFGFGLSQSGSMAGSDLIIAWVDPTGRVHLQDRYAEDEEMPVIDDHQDWILESGYENDTHTCITFTRPFLTCDQHADLPITNDIIKILWAYHDQDPVGPSALISQHQHDHRGHKSVHLLNHKFENSNHREHNFRETDHVKSWDITSNNFTLPDSDTFYWCKIVSPDFRSKAHVIRIEPIIFPPKNAPFVHHMVLYRCLHPNPEQMRDYLDMPGINCLDFQNMPFDFFHCQSIYMVWATGGEAFTMPDNVGIPIFEDHETTYFMFEIHYDNPELKANVQDSSGLRLYYTENLREFDADTATMGSVVDYRLIIPNGYENFTVSGHCSPQCFQHKMPATGINVLAALPHGHKHLKRIVVRHFRSEQELPPLAEENNYDFNFQDFRRFQQKRIILPGDQITVECTYNTDVLDRPLFGGLSTHEEMCMVFLIYYPRMKGVRTCLSGLTPETVMKLSNVAKVQRLDENDMNPVIVEPLEHANLTLSQYVLDKKDWSLKPSSSSGGSGGSTIDEQELIHAIQYAPQKAQCFWRKIEGIDGLEGMDEIKELITYPQNLRPFLKPPLQCRQLKSNVINQNLQRFRTSSSTSLFFNDDHQNLVFDDLIDFRKSTTDYRKRQRRTKTTTSSNAMSNNVQYVGGNKQTKKRNQSKYPKPTQQIYRPPSARFDSVTGTTSANSTGSYRNSCISMYNHPSDVFLIKPQPSPSSSYLGNVTSNVFPIRGVLKRSKSVGNNQKQNSKSKNFDNKIHEYHYLDETLAGTFFLTLENIPRDNLLLLKQALDRDTCSSVTMQQLLQIIRILCNKVLEKPINAAVMAKVCLEIHHNQQMNMIQLSDHKYLFLESLANCLREWFNERDKLRFTTGGAKRWTAYIMFLMEIYWNLKETVAKDLEMAKYYSNQSDSNSLNDVDDDCGDGDASSEEEDDDDDDEIVRTFALNISSSHNNNKSNESSTNDSSQADSSSCKSGSSEPRFSIKKTSSSNSIEAKIMGSLLAKQQKQFAHLILDSFHVILSNPNSTPAEIECMQTVFRKCGKYLEEDNPSRIKSIIFLIRDILLNYSNANQFINANNNCSQNASISKSLLEIVELASSGWRFNHAQQIYYFPYTRID